MGIGVVPKVIAAVAWVNGIFALIPDPHRLELITKRQVVVPEGEVPEVVKRAVVAVVDPDFFDRTDMDGVTWWGATLMHRTPQRRFPTSPLTHTLARRTLTVHAAHHPRARQLETSLAEVVFARQLEREVSKEEQVRLYLNTLHFGHGRVGIEEAADFFFGKRTAQLTLAEAALLAGLPPSPVRYSPLLSPERAARRQAFVLGEMTRLGFVSAEEAVRALAQPLNIVARRGDTPFCSAWFTGWSPCHAQSGAGGSSQRMPGRSPLKFPAFEAEETSALALEPFSPGASMRHALPDESRDTAQ